MIHKHHRFNLHRSRKPKRPEGKRRYKGKPFMAAVSWTHIIRLCLRHFICHFNLSGEWVIGLLQRANCLIVRGHLDFYLTWLSPWIARLRFKCKYLQGSFQHDQCVKAINKRNKKWLKIINVKACEMSVSCFLTYFHKIESKPQVSGKSTFRSA